MNIVGVILAIVVAYLIFIAMTYGLAHIFFPKIDIDEDQLENIADLKNNVLEIKRRISSSTKGFVERHKKEAILSADKALLFQPGIKLKKIQNCMILKDTTVV